MLNKILSATAIAALFTACSGDPSTVKDPMMDKEAANKAAFETIQKAFTTGDPKLFDGVVADNMVLHNPDPSIKSTGKQAWIDGLNFYKGMFPDMDAKIEQIVADGDWVTGVMTVTGTQTGMVDGKPGSGKKISVTSIDVYRFENGMAVENYSLFDLGTYMHQMGMGEEMAMEKEHLCNPGCKPPMHNYMHGEKGHVCNPDCPEMKKMEAEKKS